MSFDTFLREIAVFSMNGDTWSMSFDTFLREIAVFSMNGDIWSISFDTFGIKKGN